MENYKDCQINVVDNLRGEFAFSNSNKEIRINSTLVKTGEDNKNIFEEAFLAREYYCTAVENAKKNNEKFNPSKGKSDSLDKAKKAMIAKIGEDAYKSMHNQKSSPVTTKRTVIKPNSSDTDSLDIATNPDKVAKEVEKELEDHLMDDAALALEFDNFDVDIDVTNKMKVQELGDLPGKINADFSNAKDKKDIGEFEMRDIEVDVDDDIFSEDF